MLSSMGVTSREKVELASYQLREFLKCGTLNGRTIGLSNRVLLSGKNTRKLFLEVLSMLEDRI